MADLTTRTLDVNALDSDEIYKINNAGDVESRTPVSSVRDPAVTLLNSPFTPVLGTVVGGDSLQTANEKLQGQINATLTVFSTSITTGAIVVPKGTVQRYDPSGGSYRIEAPASVIINDLFGVKNVTADLTAVEIFGNGNNIEPISTSTRVALFNLVGDGVSVIWKFDGTDWLIVG